ncbi:MAG: hypothetical protein H0T42_22700 [Deltaproteobacteria bacterium]|nr:hypothetical protein [Deltaproteobacteria bacterium]
MTRFLLLAVLATACGKGKDSTPVPAEGSAENEPCQAIPFAESASVPEASGAAWLVVDGKPSLVVVSDSGNGGAYAIVDAETGVTRETGKLPLGEAGDDVEGLANRGDRIVGITSSGWILEWNRVPGAFELAQPAYPLGPVDLSDKGGGMGDKPPAGDGMVCGARATNCGRNYEGVCLVDPAHAKGPCIGFAASKADGHVYCVVEEAGKLAVKYSPRIKVTRPGAIGDCAFSDDGRLWVGSNLFDMSQVYRIDGWTTPESAKVVAVAALGIGFPEALAVRGDVIYRMSDTGGSPSLMTKFRCR